MTDFASSSAAHCPDCGARLSAGACAACSLGFLLGGGPAYEEAAERRVEENVEFGRYTLKQRLAAGGMGVVYVAEDRKLKRTVALKMIRGSTFADDGEVARFTLEAEAAASLDHPHIVPIYEVGRLDGQPFFTMKLIEGQSLAQRLREHGGVLPARELTTLLSKLARAVHHAHQRGVLHRDLKPGNVLLDAAGEPWLTDFGLAKLTGADSSLTLTKDHIGTPHYMAPEVAGGNARAVSTASDVWALGVMLWEMLCGMPPFHGPGPVEIMRRIMESEPSWPAGARADGDLVTIARRCMEKNPARRPESAGAVADELDRWLRGEPIKARPVTRRERLLKWMRREPAMAALYVVLAVAMVAGLFLWQRAEKAVISLTQVNDSLELSKNKLEHSKGMLEQSLLISTATKLAADARLQVDENATRALLLAVESVEMTEKIGVLPEAASSMMEVLQKVGGLDATPGGLQSDYNDAYIVAHDYVQTSAQASPDSRWLLTLDYNLARDQGIKAAIFDLADREHARPLRTWLLWPAVPLGEWQRCYWMPDSRRILAVSIAGEVRIWDVITPEMAAGQPVEEPPPSQSPGTVAREGMEVKQVFVRTAEPASAAVLWQRGTETLCGQVKISPDGLHPGPERNLGGLYNGDAFGKLSPDGRWLFLGHRGKPDKLYVLNPENPAEELRLLSGRDGQLRQVVVSEDGKLAVIEQEDSSIWLYELPAAETAALEIPGRRIPSQPGIIYRLALSPDNRWLSMTGSTGAVTLTPLAGDDKPVTLKLTAGRGFSVAFSRNGRWLAAGSDRRMVNLWPIDGIHSDSPPIELRGMATPVMDVKFSPDNASIIATGLGSVVRRWPFDGVNGAALPLHIPAGHYQVTNIAVSPDGEWVASACEGLDAAGRTNNDGVVTVSRLNGRDYGVITQHGRRATSVAFSRDGKWLASTGADSGVKVWDFPVLASALSQGEAVPAPTFPFKMNAVRTEYSWHLTFHPDGRLYMVDGDGTISTWDFTSKEPVAGYQFEIIHSRQYLLPDAEVSPDGRMLAVLRQGWDQPTAGSVQWGSQVLLYDVTKSWPPVFITALQAEFLDEATVTFSPDGRWLAAGSAGPGPSVWDLQAPDIAVSRRTAPVAAHSIAGIAFSPDNNRLAMGGSDGLLHFWDWKQPNDLRTIQTGAGIRSLQWLPDGHLALGGLSSYLSVWDTDVAHLKELARRLAGRQLGKSERARFRVP